MIIKATFHISANSCVRLKHEKTDNDFAMLLASNIDLPNPALLAFENRLDDDGIHVAELSLSFNPNCIINPQAEPNALAAILDELCLKSCKGLGLSQGSVEISATNLSRELTPVG